MHFTSSEMKIHVYLILPIILLFCHSNIGADAVVFFHFPGRLHHSHFQPEKADPKEVDESNSMIPFPPFLKNGIPDFFSHFWNDVDDTKSKENAANTDLVLIDKAPRKSNASIGPLVDKSMNITDAAENNKSSFKTKKLEVKLYPDSRTPLRLHSFLPLPFIMPGHFQPRDLDVSPQNTEKRDFDKNNVQLITKLHKQNLSTAENLPNTQTEQLQSCMTLLVRNIMIKTVNWASLIMHLTILLILAVIITVGIVFCCPCGSTDKTRAQIIQVKPMNV